MSHVRSLLVLSLTILLGAALVSTAEAQSRRGGGGMRGSLIGLLSNEAVQKELTLDEEQIGKVKAIGEKLRAEMGEQFGKLRDIEDRDARRAKMTELSDEIDSKVRQQAGEVIGREKMRRLYQIRLQVRGALYGLSSRFVAGRLKLTDEQKAKVAELEAATQKQIGESFTGGRDMSAEQRGELFQKMRKIRTDADEKAIGLLNADQKEAFEQFKGEKFEF
ncbi:MAG TPA: Spy/CpxP family protein refolding chaperone [Thermoguttaceae bacterium]|nr:Spy/CpxP family protein refolding chaperone [Thermoguttaceae bacterium]